MDPMQGGWIHKLCTDPELLEEFAKFGDFGWYLDLKKTMPISQERVWAADIGDHENVFVIDDFHWHHCEFVIKSSLKNALPHNRPVGFLTLNPDHVFHCYERVANWNTPELRNGTEIVRLFGFTLRGECYMPIP
jgi:hypothetical protein